MKHGVAAAERFLSQERGASTFKGALGTSATSASATKWKQWSTKSADLTLQAKAEKLEALFGSPSKERNRFGIHTKNFQPGHLPRLEVFILVLRCQVSIYASMESPALFLHEAGRSIGAIR